MSTLSQNSDFNFDMRLFKRALIPLVLLLGAAVLGGVVGFLEWKLSILLLVGLTGLPVLAFGFVRLDYGIILMLTIGFFIEFFRKYSDAPLGIALDGLLVVFAVSMLAGLAKSKDFAVFKHPVSYMVLVWMYYCIFQFFNPWTVSRMAWLFTVRSLAGLLFLYFIAVYALDTVVKVKRVIKAVLALGVVAALYGLNQEFNGFSQAELAWLYQDEKRFQLIFQWSRMRVFSLFAEPTTCGIVMGYLAAMCSVMVFGPYKVWQKALLGIGALMMIAVMGYAGSRTPIAMFPAGLAFFVLLNPKKHILIISLVFFTFGTLAMLKSSSNPVLHRIQSAFKPGADASVQVRMDNQKLVQPYIRTMPIGSGLGTTGDWGRRFAPGFWLANFAHDSGLVRIAVEAGWIGLIIYITFLFTIMVTGIRQFFRVRDPVIKNLTLAILIVMFCLMIASYPQEAIPMLPTSLVFYLLLACMVRLGKLDEAQQEALSQESSDQVVTTTNQLA
ncbi:MAG: O-antigen ligase family protein [Saprospiraceae bacterium]